MNATNPVHYTPYRCSGVDASPAIGFQPTAGLCPFVFTGFAQPIDNGGMWNLAKAGWTIPVKWNLTGATGRSISDPSSFVKLTYAKATCPARSVHLDAIETYSSGSKSRLSYLGHGNWKYGWATSRSLRGSCYTMTVWFSDGTTQSGQRPREWWESAV